MKSFLYGMLRSLATGLVIACLYTACSSTTPVLPDPVIEPSPSPTPAPIYVIVRAEGSQGGRVTTGVQAGTDFKITGTPTACYQGGQPIDCGVIPRWQQRQTGGFGAQCAPYGSLSSRGLNWNCHEPAGAATFEVCAISLEGAALGCDQWVMYIG